MKKLVLFFLVAQTLISCSSDSSQSVADEYDRSAVLLNWADNIILPSLENYNQKLIALKNTTASFTAQPDEAQLESLRTQWVQAYKAYQHVAIFNIGKAEELQFSKYCNTYPTNTALIDTKINNADINIEGPGNDVAQGFPALDYLLYGLGGDKDAVLSFYTDNEKAVNYKNYLTAVVEKLAGLNAAIIADWAGNYRSAFISKTDNTSAGSLNKMVNAYIQHFEKEVRSFKVGIPAGRFSMTPLPEKVEGFYSKQYSKEFLQEGLLACKNFFNGKHFNTNSTGASLASYLEFLKAKGNGADAETILAVLIDNQFIAAQTAISDMDANLHQQVINDNNKMLLSFDKMQRNVAYMKTDMVSAMSISIDYADTDGD